MNKIIVASLFSAICMMTFLFIGLVMDSSKNRKCQNNSILFLGIAVLFEVIFIILTSGIL